jgi:hypothetical protein
MFALRAIPCRECVAYTNPDLCESMMCPEAPNEVECGGCGRAYPAEFPTCPFCYVNEFLKVEAEDGCCPICDSPHKQKVCPKCGREYGDSRYCLKCGYIKGQGGAY